MVIMFAKLVYSPVRLASLQTSPLVRPAQMDTIYSIIVVITVQLIVPPVFRATFASYVFQDTSLTMATAPAYQVWQAALAAYYIILQSVKDVCLALL